MLQRFKSQQFNSYHILFIIATVLLIIKYLLLLCITFFLYLES